MSVKIRLRRTGKINQPCHRIVVTDIRSPRDGSFIECIGFYDPRHKVEQIDLARVDYWVGKGAKASDTVGAIVKRAREGKPMTPEQAKEKAATPAATPAAGN
ncbi:MAG: 30S ribosomal protein S16 [Lentisphaeria bacterium]